ncbi:hypothetical protein BofuT4_uP051230.1 [Botrytis cinerea T4]|uniref:Uncharacterized protein n=1 Tax=Botryotinia fuckeliana (strain T4) TaxID=999810 RepID=G2XWU6_BOTF4|nr:hypothetical protein BofuT4_uP051230.1 [Botrytis cinerea T4]
MAFLQQDGDAQISTNISPCPFLFPQDNSCYATCSRMTKGYTEFRTMALPSQ